ncbi:MAG: ribbon-helix-helix protein, CopG family [Nanoarchaeota archaeon]|nr:ribbon-helix-helix protein, CopG family [Nanoarchaeota archaeon]
MTVSKENIRLQVVLTKEEAKKIEKLAKNENRSVSNWIATLIRSKLK